VGQFSVENRVNFQRETTEVMAAALIDRILHHCHIVNIRGNSYRMRHHTEVWRTLRQDAEESAPRARRKVREGNA